MVEWRRMRHTRSVEDENKISNTIEAALVCRFRLGNLVRMPFAKIAPWKIPIPKTIAKEIRKFSSTNSIIPMLKNW